MIAFLLDEHYFNGPLAKALRRPTPDGRRLDVVCVGEPVAAGLPLSSPDDRVLMWAEAAGRVLVTRDRNTMIAHLHRHLAAGRHSPGVLCVRPDAEVDDVVADLMLIALAGHPDDFADQVTWVPFRPVMSHPA